MRDHDLAVLDELTLAELEKELDAHTREVIEPDRWTSFSWSASRASLFEHCKRQYYLNYYGARRVREAKNKVVSAIWWLKQITSLRAWIGTVIHQTAGNAIKAYRDGKPLDEDKLPGEAVKFYRDGVRASDRGAKHNGQWIVLFEHVHPETETAVTPAQGETLVHDMAQTLLASDAYGFIKSVPPKSITEVDEPFQSFSFDLQSHGPLPVYAIPDVMIRSLHNIYMVDWKTGDVTKEGIRQQAGVYQLYAAQKYGVPEGNIFMAISELGGMGESFDPPGGMPSLAETSAFIHKSAKAMLGKLEDVAYNTAAIKRYPMTDDLSKCRECGFKRACGRQYQG